MFLQMFSKFIAELRTEVSATLLRFYIGLILAFAIIFSIAQLGMALQVELEYIENGFEIHLATFTSIAIACALGLYFLFRSRKKKEDTTEVTVVVQEEAFDFRSLVAPFLQGIVVGYRRIK